MLENTTIDEFIFYSRIGFKYFDIQYPKFNVHQYPTIYNIVFITNKQTLNILNQPKQHQTHIIKENAQTVILINLNL